MVFNPFDWTSHLLALLRQVQQEMGIPPVQADGASRFADLVDSMALVEFVALVAEDCGVKSEVIEQCVDRQFGTVEEMASSLSTAALVPQAKTPGNFPLPSPKVARIREHIGSDWLAGIVIELPAKVQQAATINAALNKPAGWLENHAGIKERHLWMDQDPLDAATNAGRKSLDQAGIKVSEVGALLITSEAPPLLAGLAAALHHRLELPPAVVAIDVGGACTGFLTALWLGKEILHRANVVLIIAVEAPSFFLSLRPGEAGETASLFGDGAAACVLAHKPTGPTPIPLEDVILGCDGNSASLLQVVRSTENAIEVNLRGVPLAGKAVGVMAQGVRDMARHYGLTMNEILAVVAHGGNGRLPALLARRLEFPVGKVWSETYRTGNLGSASLPVSWAAHQPVAEGPVIWTSFGAGLTWGVAITGALSLVL